MINTGTEPQALSKVAEDLIFNIQKQRDAILHRSSYADALLREGETFARLVLVYLQINDFEAAVDCSENAESLYLSAKELSSTTEVRNPGHSKREKRCDEPIHVSRAPDQADQSDAIFRGELSGLAIPPQIGAVMEKAREKRMGIWGSQAEFGKFAKSTYFPLLMCLNDPQERPRAVLQAVNAGEKRLADLYRQSIGLPEYYSPKFKPRIRNTQWLEDWRSYFMVIEIIHQMRWAEATHDRNAYIKGAVVRAFQNRQSEEEREHINARTSGVIVDYLDGDVEAPWTSIATLEFALDFDSSVDQANKLGIKDEEFPQIMRDLVYSAHTWEEIAAQRGVPPEQRKHFSVTAKRLYEPKLRCFRERMKAYHLPPCKTIDERLAADQLNRPGSAKSKWLGS